MEAQLRRILSRAVNENQLLILSALNRHSPLTAFRLAELLWREHRRPVSTTKLNLHVLRNLEIIKLDNGHPVRLTEFGRFVLRLLGGEQP